jgi:flagellar biosynthesis protein FlhG
MLDHGLDQAEGLRRLMAPQTFSLMALPLGPDAHEGWIPPLARALRGLGARLIVLDGSRGRLARAFGLQPRYELLDLLDGGRSFEAVAQCTREGVYLLRADRGLDAFVATGADFGQLARGFAQLPQGFDAFLVVLPAAELASLAAPLQTVPVVCVDSSDAGLTRGYQMIKQLSSRFGYRRFAAVVREMHAGPGARGAHARLMTVARGFLDVDVSFAGGICSDATGGEAGMAELAHYLLHTVSTPLTLH